MTVERGSTEIFLQVDARVVMRDSVVLHADIYRPGRAGKPALGRFPTILVRTSYDKGAIKAQECIDPEYFVKRGYAVVAEDVRGRYRSEGSYYHGVYEANDGYDTIEWIASQPWSDGKVGMTGISYLAAVQCAAAIANPPHLASLFHVKAPTSYYQDSDRCGGAFRMHMVTVIFYFAATATDMRKEPALTRSLQELYQEAPYWLKRWPIKKGLSPLSRTPELERWLLDLMNYADYDKRWKDVPLWEPVQFFEKYADVPGFYLGGWYDMYREALFFKGLSGRKKGPIKLMMGPWTHMDLGQVSGDVDFGPAAKMSFEEYNELQLRWFDETLRGVDTGILRESPVRIFVMGGGSGRRTTDGRLDHGGRWRYEREWPLARTRYTPYHLHQDGTLSTERPSEKSSSSTYAYDPKNPVPTIGGTAYLSRLKPGGPLPIATGDVREELIVPYGASDQRESISYFHCTNNLPLSSRYDNLVFQTAPLTEEVEATGPITLRLWASSSAVDTDFTAKLIDVYPPSDDYPLGYAMNIVDRILRARYRNGFERAEFMKPGQAYEFSIELPEASNLFARGHRIRLDVSSSNFPQFDPNPNTGDVYMNGGRFVVADNTIYHDSFHPSHVILPIVPP